MVSLTPVATSANEGGAAGTFQLELTDESSTATLVDFTVGGSAQRTDGAAAHLATDFEIWVDDGSGFVMLANNATQFTIPAGVVLVDVEIRAVDDAIVELQEDLTLTITGVSNGPQITLGTPTGGTVTIADNDEAILILKANEPTAAEFDTTPGQFTVSLVQADGITPAPIGFDLTAVYSIAGSAVNGVFGDFGFISGNVSFAAGGSTSIPIDIVPIDDGDVEGDETVELTLSSFTSSTPSAPLTSVSFMASMQSDTVTILDNDGEVTAQDDSSTLTQGGTVTGNVLADNGNGVDSDDDLVDATATPLPGDELTVSLDTGPSFGALILNADGSFSYTHDGSANSQDSFVYTVTDSAGNTDTATVSLDIEITSTIEVADLVLNGTAWNSDFRNFLDGGFNDGVELGYRVLDNPGVSVPWVNVDEILIQFTSDVGASLTPSDFVFTGSDGFDQDFLPGAVPTITGVTFDNVTNVATLSLSTALEANVYTLTALGAGITDGTATLTDFTTQFVALPGDALDVSSSSPSGTLYNVQGSDTTFVRSSVTGFLNDSPGVTAFDGPFFNYDVRADLDGSANVDGSDVTRARDRLTSFVFPTSPVVPVISVPVISVPVTAAPSVSAASTSSEAVELTLSSTELDQLTDQLFASSADTEVNQDVELDDLGNLADDIFEGFDSDLLT